MGASKWGYLAVQNILTHPKYSGCHVYGRTSQKLYGPTIRLPREKWTMTPEAWEPIIDESTFQEAQRILQNRTINKSDEELLDELRLLLQKQGRLSLRIIQNADSGSPSVYRRRFGSLRAAYKLIAYGRPSDFGPIDLRRRTQVPDDLMLQLQSLFPDLVSIVRRGGRWRSGQAPTAWLADFRSHWSVGSKHEGRIMLYYRSCHPRTEMSDVTRPIESRE